MAVAGNRVRCDDVEEALDGLEVQLTLGCDVGAGRLERAVHASVDVVELLHREYAGSRGACNPRRGHRPWPCAGSGSVAAGLRCAVQLQLVCGARSEELVCSASAGCLIEDEPGARSSVAGQRHELAQWRSSEQVGPHQQQVGDLLGLQPDLPGQPPILGRFPSACSTSSGRELLLGPGGTGWQTTTPWSGLCRRSSRAIVCGAMSGFRIVRGVSSALIRAGAARRRRSLWLVSLRPVARGVGLLRP